VIRKRKVSFGPAAILVGEILGLMIAGCALLDETGEPQDGIRVHSAGRSIVFSNGSAERVYYFLVGRELATVIDWLPHLDEELSVGPGESREIPLDTIPMAEAETELIAYWWAAVESDGKRAPGPVRTTIVPI
jgi:hypothetical protein